MTSKTYALAMLLFNIMGLAVVYALQRLQSVLPLNPQGLSAVTPDSSWNTAVGTAQLLRDNLLTHGLGGLVVPFIGIKLIDMLLVAFGLA